MDKLNIAIADDNAKVLQLLDKIVSSDEEKQEMAKICMILSKSRSRMSYFWIWSCPKSMG